MEDSIMLHQQPEIFKSAIKETADKLEIRDFFIEKDYWISLVLKRLSESKHVDSFVFKGGTSLSKGFKLINRFSEDVDIAVINVNEVSGNKIKALIRAVEKEITCDLEEVNVPGVTSKGSRFRKSVYKYPASQKRKAAEVISSSIIIEINSFTNPYPYSKISMRSLIGEYLQNNNQEDLINKYGLEAFEINVLGKEQTLIEKLVSLIRFSFDRNPLEAISGKIRHFYDLYYLMKDVEVSKYIHSSKFIQDLQELLDHDKKTFDEPIGWKEMHLSDSSLLNDFDGLWNSLKKVYTTELSMLSFTPIPDEKDVLNSFKKLIMGIETKLKL